MAAYIWPLVVRKVCCLMHNSLNEFIKLNVRNPLTQADNTLEGESFLGE